LIIEETNNPEEIKSILCHKDIFDLSRDNKKVNVEDFEPPMDNVFYVGGYEGNKIFALSCFHQFKGGLKFHPHVLKSHRQRYGREFVQYTASMLKCILYIEIPEKRKDLFNLAKKLGFDSLANNKDQANHKILMRLV